ncbi:MAG: hypothetical protein LBE82_13735 [Chitinophagaceae bacterium]|jgi:hypothetical protein|nr:hypothetical protein [Chitinophagaceae bacterium]
MKKRILTGWNFGRVIYAALGILLIVQSIWQAEWWGILFGGYFAAMGIFAFGCATGNCFSNASSNTSPDKITDISYEEVK